MKVIYEAFDGSRFEDEKGCIEYENKLTCWKGWSWKFEPTDVPHMAGYLYLPNKYDYDEEVNMPAKSFIEKSKQLKVAYDGIYDDSFGFYVWNEWEDSYSIVLPEAISFVIKHTDLFDSNGEMK